MIGQLTKLYMCAPVVLGLDRPNETVDRLVAKVTRDIIDFKSPRMKICRHIMKKPFSRDELVTVTDLSIERVNRELQDMMALRMLYGHKTDSSSGLGRKVLRVQLSPELTASLQHIGFE